MHSDSNVGKFPARATRKGRTSRPGPGRKAHLRRLALEGLEPRALMAMVPAPTAFTYAQGLNGVPGNDSAPSIAYDPMDPQRMVAAFTRTDPGSTINAGQTATYIELAYSSDGGATWSVAAQTAGNWVDIGKDQTNGPIYFGVGSDATVAFDRNHNFYLAYSQHAADNSSGQLALNKFDFGGAIPNRISTSYLYRWVTPQQGYAWWQALHPVVAVDNNVPSYQDPITGEVQQDPDSGNVYVAWGTVDVPPQTVPPSWNPYAIRMVTSSDGGQTFGTIQTVSDQGNFTSPNHPVYGGHSMSAYPKIIISQGTAAPAGQAPRVQGGLVTVVWDDFGIAANKGLDLIRGDKVNGSSGLTFSNTTSTSINDAGANPAGQGPDVPHFTYIPIDVNSLPSSFTTLNNLTVTVDTNHATIGELRFRLIPPTGSGLDPIILLNNNTNADGMTNTGFGMTGAGLGGPTPSRAFLGTVFDANAQAAITGNQGGAASIGRFRPETTALNVDAQLGNSGTFIPSSPYTTLGAVSNAGLSAGQLLGTWNLEITDFRQSTGNPPPPRTLLDWSLTLQSGGVTGTDFTISSSTVRGNFDIPLPLGANVSPIGIGPQVTGASDNTLGSFSPLQGRIYVGYVDRYNSAIPDPAIYKNSLHVGPPASANPADNTDIFLVYSDDGGATWSRAIQVNDDANSRTDGYSEGWVNTNNPQGMAPGTITGRPQFTPSLAVDNTTGTLVASFYDARYDAARSRVAMTVTASLDGGLSWSKQDLSFANQPQQARDIISGQVITLGPIPDNQSPGNPNTSTGVGFGTSQGLVAHNGKIAVAWSGNLNGGIDGRATLDTQVTLMHLTAGPRVISSTQGPVTAQTVADYLGNVYTINANTGNGPVANGFLVTFDRPVDFSSFTAADVAVRFRDPSTSGFANGTPVPLVGQPIPLDQVIDRNGYVLGATRWLVRFAPQTAVGTLTYTVGPHIYSKVGAQISADAALNPIFQTTQEMDQNANGSSTVADLYADPQPASGAGTRPPFDTTSLPLQVPGPFIINTFVPNVSTETVDNLIADGSQKFAYTGANTVIGAGLTVDTPIGVTAPLNIQSLAVSLGLSVADASKLDAVLVVPGTGQMIRLFTGSQLAAGANFTNTTFDDAAAVPIAGGLPPYTGTYQPQDKLGILAGIIPTGNYVLRITNHGATAATLTSYALTFRTSAVASVLGVTFDRPMDSSTFTVADIARMVGPAGEVKVDPTNPAWSVTADPSDPRTFYIHFPAQQLSGTYTVTFGPDIRSRAIDPATGLGYAMDTNQNAGLDVLRNTPSAGTQVNNYFPGTVNVPIVANGVTDLPITVGDAFSVQQVTLALNLAFPNDPDLEAYLIAPGGIDPMTGQALPGAGVLLFSGVGQTNPTAGFSNTGFADTAIAPIQNGSPPFIGTFNPQVGVAGSPSPINSGLTLTQKFQNVPSQGAWTLRIINHGSKAGTLKNWQLNLTQPLSQTGLGEPVADQATASFRIFAFNPTNALSTTMWTSVGPAGIGASVPGGNGRISGRISAVAVDPSDPSGNTVFAGAASGGLWKTTDFLTTDPKGPTWIPLTDFGPNFGLNVGSLAVFPRNNDPRQTIVLVATGEGADLTVNGGDGKSQQGVGFLRSTDGGLTWDLLDSSTNYDAQRNLLPINANQRDHMFVGTSAYRVVADPTLTPGGEVIFYAALSDVDGSGRAGGLWRSLDTGRTWTRVRAGQATDVVLDLNSGKTSTSGNVDILQAAFRGDGVYLSPNRGQAWSLMAGGIGDPQIQAYDASQPTPIPVGAPVDTPNGGKGRIVLARPALTGIADEDTLYQGWLYAVVATPGGILGGGGHLDGLYMTKDFGQNWVQVQIPADAAHAGDLPSNDDAKGNIDPLGTNTFKGTSFGAGNFDLTLTVDPNNPNVVYLGGTSEFAASGLIRIDTTGIFDAKAFYLDNRDDDGGLRRTSTQGPVSLKVPTAGDTSGRTPYGQNLYTPVVNPYLNLVVDPNNRFTVGSTILVTNVQRFSNTGAQARWIPFDRAVEPDMYSYETGTDYHWAIPTRGQHQTIAMVDPTSGRTRLIFADDQGIYTAVDKGDGTLIGSLGDTLSQGNLTALGSLDTALGDRRVVSGSRVGNLAVTQFYYGAAQPSNLAAQLSLLRGMFYGTTNQAGYPQSDANIINPAAGTAGGYGNTSAADNPMLVFQPGLAGGGVATDATGTGKVFEYKTPNSMVENSYSPTDFFQINNITKTNLLTQAANTGADVPDPQWPYLAGLNFAVNPLSPQQIVISSSAGRIFGTTNGGNIWSAIGDPQSLDGTYAQALAFGAPLPQDIAGQNLNSNNFIYAGTRGGKIFVTFTGGGTSGQGNQWTNISQGLDGTAIQRIITNPTPGSNEAYAITQQHVYHMVNSGVQNAKWVDVTGNLYATTHDSFGQAILPEQQMLSLDALVADWRYVIPDNFANPGGSTHPILYVGGTGGVFRSIDGGQTWMVFPDTGPSSLLNAPRPAGNLPVTEVTDLDLSVGNYNTTTGRPDTSTGPNALLASTWGRGLYAIRLAPIVLPTSVGLDPNRPAGGSDTGRITNDQVTRLLQPYITGFSQQTAFGSAVTINLIDLTPTDATYNQVIGTGTTDTSGFFSVQITSSYWATHQVADGMKALGIQAVDGSGTLGNVVNFSFELDTTPPTLPGAPDLQAASDSGSSNSDNDTNVTSPVFDVTPVDPGATIELYRKPLGAPDTAYVRVNSSFTQAGPGLISIKDPGPVADGQYEYAALEIDVAGNPSVSYSPSLVVTIDTTAPAPANAPDLQAGSDSGPAAGAPYDSDNYTNVTSPTFDVSSVEATATVQLLRKPTGSPDTAYAVVGTRTGPGSITDSGSLPDGSYIYAVQQVDLAGNPATALSSTLAVTIDTTPPSAASKPVLQAASDSGLSQADNNTNAASRTFNVATAEPTAVVQLLRKPTGMPDSAYGVVGSRTGPGAITDAATLADGQYDYAVQQVDLAGNPATALSPALTVTLDTTPPPPPSTPTLAAADDTAPAGDNQTTVRRPHLVVTFDLSNPNVPLDAGTLVEILDANDTVLGGTTTPQADGSYSVMIVNPLPDGTYVLHARATDPAGNTTRSAGDLTLTIVAPPAPAAPGAPDLQAASDSGASQADDITNVLTPTFDITAAAGGTIPAVNTVQLLRKPAGAPDTAYIVVASRTGPGAITDSTLPAPTPPNARYEYAARQVDPDSNLGLLSGSLTVNFDPFAPANPTAPTLSAADDSGVKGDNITNVPQPRLTGTAEPGARLDLLLPGGTAGTYQVVGTTTVKADGTYSVQPSMALADGQYRFLVQATDVAGNASGRVQGFAGTPLTIDTGAPATPTTPQLLPADDNAVGVPNDNTTNNARPRFIGTAEPGVTVEILSAGAVIGSATANTTTGAFTVQVTTQGDGKLTVQARARDAAGNTSVLSGPLTITIDTKPPYTPTLPSMLPGDDHGTPGDNITNAQQPHFLGWSEPGAAVVLLDQNNRPLATGTVAADGHFFLQPSFPLAEGPYQLRFQATDGAGNVSTSPTLPVTIDITPPATRPTLLMDWGTDTGIVGDAITTNPRPTFVGFGEPSLPVNLYGPAGNVIGSTVAAPNGLYVVRPAANLSPGRYTLRSRVLDVAGNVGYFTGDLVVTIRQADADYDGDGRSDPAVYDRPTATTLIAQPSGTPRAMPFGLGNEAPLNGDFDGDGKTDVATYDRATATFRLSQSVLGNRTTPLGAAGVSVPAVADFDGDGKTDLAVYDPTSRAWTVVGSAAGLFPAVTFGFGGDTPVPADYDGIGRAEFAVFHPGTGTWAIAGPQGGRAFQFGPAGSVAVPGDYDGDGKADPAVFDPATGAWSVLNSSTPPTSTPFGGPGLIPAPADFDGDGKTDLAVYDPTRGLFAILQSSTHTVRAQYLGPANTAVPTMAPLPYRLAGAVTSRQAAPALNFGAQAASLGAGTVRAASVATSASAAPAAAPQQPTVLTPTVAVPMVTTPAAGPAAPGAAVPNASDVRVNDLIRTHETTRIPHLRTPSQAHDIALGHALDVLAAHRAARAARRPRA